MNAKTVTLTQNVNSEIYWGVTADRVTMSDFFVSNESTTDTIWISIDSVASVGGEGCIPILPSPSVGRLVLQNGATLNAFTTGTGVKVNVQGIK